MLRAPVFKTINVKLAIQMIAVNVSAIKKHSCTHKITFPILNHKVYILNVNVKLSIDELSIDEYKNVCSYIRAWYFYQLM